MFIVFVGEQRSKTAIARNWTWFDKRLCAKKLIDVLDSLNINPKSYTFVNMYTDKGEMDRSSLDAIRYYESKGCTIVGLGRHVQQTLRAGNVEHLAMVHPAARGKIRNTTLYKQHVQGVLQTLGDF